MKREACMKWEQFRQSCKQLKDKITLRLDGRNDDDGRRDELIGASVSGGNQSCNPQLTRVRAEDH
jgi:hypothetical protein